MWYKILSLACFFFFSCSVLAENYMCPEPIKVGWGDYPPFTEADEDAEMGVAGIDIELFNMMAEDVGCEVKYINAPWVNLLQSLKNGTIDVVTGASKTKDREDFSHFLSPYIQDTNALFMKKADIKKYAGKIKNFEDMAKIPGFILGVAKGNYYGKEFEKARQNPKFNAIVREFKNDEEEVEQIDMSKGKEKITAFLADIVFTYNHKEKEKIKAELDIYPLSISNEGLYFAYSKKSFEKRHELMTKLNESMNKFINRLFNNDAFEDILSRYLTKNQVDLLRVN